MREGEGYLLLALLGFVLILVSAAINIARVRVAVRKLQAAVDELKARK